jgi:hypothetical protein
MRECGAEGETFFKKKPIEMWRGTVIRVTTERQSNRRNHIEKSGK